MATVTLKGIQKDYGAVQVIKGVDLSIDDREFCVFVGPSGCGKSTLLRMIAGLEEISAGDLMIDGQRVNDVPPSERGLAMVFQSYALYPHMSVADNMGFSLRLAGASKEERRAKVAEAARILHLDAFLDRKPKELSGGQRQRVAIGRAIVRKPKVFLFDEPLSNLDAALRVQMRIEFARLHDELAATMIYVTHDQVEAMTMADKIVVLQGGIIEQAGTPLEFYHHPRNLFVAGFIGSPKMNFLPAKVTGIDEAGTTVQLASGATWSSRFAPAARRSASPSRWAFGPSICGWARRAKSLGEVKVVERLGGETFLYTQLEDGAMLIVQTDGEIPTGVHERVAIKLDPVDLPSVRRRGSVGRAPSAPSSGEPAPAADAQGELSVPGGWPWPRSVSTTSSSAAEAPAASLPAASSPSMAQGFCLIEAGPRKSQPHPGDACGLHEVSRPRHLPDDAQGGAAAAARGALAHRAAGQGAGRRQRRERHGLYSRAGGGLRCLGRGDGRRRLELRGSPAAFHQAGGKRSSRQALSWRRAAP